VLLCPGRGSYGKDELGWIARRRRQGPVADALAAADAARAARGEPTLTELDSAPAFKPSVHLNGRHAAELIYFATLLHHEELRARYRIVGVAGNSLGWYTALAAAGCLSPSDGWRLVTTMARVQELARGEQVMTTTVGDDWLPDAQRVAAVEAALRAVNARGDAFYVAHSIRLGGHAVLAGTPAGIAELLRALPPIQLRERTFPFRLAGHGPFHTALCHDVARAARAELNDLDWRAPAMHLLDGMGRLHTPWSADPDELFAYTTGVQVTETFDFTSAARVALRELLPDVLLCAGPGTSLRAPAGHVVLQEGYHGMHTKAELFAGGPVRTA
jgi:malonyl CoA-acyl carrier protein transacylase